MDQFLQNIKSREGLLTLGVLSLGILVFFVKAFYVPQIFSVAHLFNVDVGLMNGAIWFVVVGILSMYFLKDYRYTYLEMTMILLLVYSILSSLWSLNLASNLAANAILLTLFLVYLFLKHFINIKGEQSTVLISIGICSMVLLVCFHYLVFNAENILNISSGTSYHNEIKYLQSFVGGKNETGILLALSIPFIFFNLLNKKAPWLSSITLLICAATILVTGCRNAYLALFVFFVVLILQYKFSKKQLIIGCISFLVVFTVFLYIVGVRKFGNLIFRDSLHTRRDLWSNLLDVYSVSNPFTGVGSGQWVMVKDQLNLTKQLHPHNDILSYLVELGIVGIALFLIILGVFIYRLIKTKKTDNITSWYWVNIVLIAAFTSSLVLFNFDEIKFKLNHCSLMFLIWAFISYRYEESLESNQFVNKNIGRVFTTLFSVLILGYGILFTQQSSVFNKVQEQRKDSNWDGMLFQKSNLFPSFVNQIGKEPVESYVHQAYVESNKLQDRILSLLKVEREFPYHVNNNERLAYYYFGNLEYQKALEHLSRISTQKPCIQSIGKILQSLPNKEKQGPVYNRILERTKNCRSNIFINRDKDSRNNK